MPHEVIFETLEHDWQRLRSHLPHPHYHHNQEQHPDHTPEAPSMSLATIEAGLRGIVTKAETAVHDAAAEAAPHLTELADIASEISQSTLFQTVLSATLGADDEAFVVKIVQNLDKGAHDLEGDVNPPVATTAPVTTAAAGETAPAGSDADAEPQAAEPEVRTVSAAQTPEVIQVPR